MKTWKFNLALFELLIVAALISVILSGCHSNPLTVAQTPEEKAYALYGTFVVFEEQAAIVIKQAATPVDAKTAIRKADAAAKPVADALLAAVREYILIKGELAAGTTTNDKLVLATANLNKWVAQATPLIQALVISVGGK